MCQRVEVVAANGINYEVVLRQDVSPQRVEFFVLPVGRIASVQVGKSFPPEIDSITQGFIYSWLRAVARQEVPVA